MSVESFDVFKLTFDTLRLAIQDSSNYASEQEHETLIRNFDSIFQAYVASEFESSSNQSLAYIQLLRKQLLTACSTKIDMYRQQLLAATTSIAEAYSCGQNIAISSHRKNNIQRYNAEKRMKELVFEIIGEYKKCQMRVQSRRQFVAVSSKLGRIISTWNLMWQRYLLRLSYEVTLRCQDIVGKDKPRSGIQCQRLCFKRDATEISGLVNKLLNQQLFAALGEVSIASITRISKVVNSTDSRAPPPHERLFVMSNFEDMVRLPGFLANWLHDRSLTSVINVAGRNCRPSSSTQPRRPSQSPRSAQRSGNSNRLQVSSAMSSLGDVEDLLVKNTRDKLLTFLRCKTIDWLHPASYPLRQYGILKRKGLIPGQESSPLDSFSVELLFRHSAQVENDRVYICLEERARSSAIGGILSLDSNPKDESSRAAYDILQAMQFVQETYLTGLGNSTAAEFSQLSDQLLKLTRYCAAHRHRPHIHPGPVQSIIEEFPDIVEVENMDTRQTYHFAAASRYHLLETAVFAQSALTSDDIRQISGQCPHPCLSRLVSSSTEGKQPLGALSNLFVLVRIPTYLLPGFSSAQLSTSTGDQAGANPKRNPSSDADVIRIMLPLSLPVVSELLGNSFLPAFDNIGSSFLRQYVDGEVPSPSLLQCFSPCSSANLLPDHPVRRLHPKPLEKARITSTKYGWDVQNLSNDEQRNQDIAMNHSYILFYSELVENDNSNHVVTSGGRPVSGKQQASASESIKLPCYYLVQVCAADLVACEELKPVIAGTAEFGSIELMLNKILSETEDSASASLTALHIALRMQNTMLTDVLPAGQPLCLGRSHSHDLSTWLGHRRNTLILEKDSASPVNDESANAQSIAQAGWDSGLLFSLCRWRSCLADAIPSVTTIQPKSAKKRVTDSVSCLCGFHDELKRFLDFQSQVSTSPILESSKYLPRSKPPATSGKDRDIDPSNKDLVLIRAASTLLQEMCDGKLKSTLQSYLKKVSREFSYRSRLNIALSAVTSGSVNDEQIGRILHSKRDKKTSDDSGMPLRPKWAKWNQEGAFESAMQQLQQYQTKLETIQALEQGVSREIIALGDMKIYPSPELAVIRKDIKTFKDFEDQSLGSIGESDMRSEEYHLGQLKVLDMELQLSERKLNILKARREDEDDARALMLRKAAKLKALEEAQSKDPHSFRNQRSRF